MKVQCDYCGGWFDPSGPDWAFYCPHCDKWTCATCHLEASHAWLEKRRARDPFVSSVPGEAPVQGSRRGRKDNDA